jgi:hypothetical protein
MDRSEHDARFDPVSVHIGKPKVGRGRPQDTFLFDAGPL